MPYPSSLSSHPQCRETLSVCLSCWLYGPQNWQQISARFVRCLTLANEEASVTHQSSYMPFLNKFTHVTALYPRVGWNYLSLPELWERINNFIHSTGHMVILILRLDLIRVSKRGLGPQFEFFRDVLILLGNLTVDKIHGKRWYKVDSFVISSLDPALIKCSKKE